MVDKITTVSKAKVQHRIGRLSVEDLNRLNRSMLIFLGLTSSIGR
jgi:mRNA interferase MazF